jgi:hypothetical protein
LILDFENLERIFASFIVPRINNDVFGCACLKFEFSWICCGFVSKQFLIWWNEIAKDSPESSHLQETTQYIKTTHILSNLSQ